MNVPVLVLLGFAAWTLLTLIAGVGVYRWGHILTRRTSIVDWWADTGQGGDWYRRATRAHMNCVENLPVYGAIVVALTVAEVRSPLVNGLSVAMLAARIGQTLTHVGLPPTDASASLRFALFFVEMICMIGMGGAAAVAMVK